MAGTRLPPVLGGGVVTPLGLLDRALVAGRAAGPIGPLRPLAVHCNRNERFLLLQLKVRTRTVRMLSNGMICWHSCDRLNVSIHLKPLIMTFHI